MIQPSASIQKMPQLTCDADTQREKLNQLDAAIADYDTAIRLNPTYAYAYERRGDAREKINQLDAAIADYDTAIRFDPNDAYVYVRRGNAKEKLNQIDAAIADYDTAIRLNPNDAYVYVQRGHAKKKLNQFDAAIADYGIQPSDSIQMKLQLTCGAGWVKKSNSIDLTPPSLIMT